MTLDTHNKFIPTSQMGDDLYFWKHNNCTERVLPMFAVVTGVWRVKQLKSPYYHSAINFSGFDQVNEGNK